jgi:hypothetical protein
MGSRTKHYINSEISIEDNFSLVGRFGKQTSGREGQFHYHHYCNLGEKLFDRYQKEC